MFFMSKFQQSIYYQQQMSSTSNNPFIGQVEGKNLRNHGVRPNPETKEQIYSKYLLNLGKNRYFTFDDIEILEGSIIATFVETLSAARVL
jgi:hypothetical protein